MSGHIKNARHPDKATRASSNRPKGQYELHHHAVGVFSICPAILIVIPVIGAVEFNSTTVCRSVAVAIITVRKAIAIVVHAIVTLRPGVLAHGHIWVSGAREVGAINVAISVVVHSVGASLVGGLSVGFAAAVGVVTTCEIHAIGEPIVVVVHSVGANSCNSSRNILYSHRLAVRTNDDVLSATVRIGAVRVSILVIVHAVGARCVRFFSRKVFTCVSFPEPGAAEVRTVREPIVVVIHTIGASSLDESRPLAPLRNRTATNNNAFAGAAFVGTVDHAIAIIIDSIGTRRIRRLVMASTIGHVVVLAAKVHTIDEVV